MKTWFDNTVSDQGEGAGLFSMDIKTGMVFADRAVAEAFGFPENIASQGIPREDFYEKINPEFRSYIAELIARSVESGEQIQVSYSITRADGTIIKVLGSGQCFKSAEGEPLHYAGIVVPLSTCDQRRGSEVVAQLLAAHESAVRLGSEEGAKRILDAITTILAEHGVLLARH